MTSPTSGHDAALHPARGDRRARDHLLGQAHLNVSVAVQHHPSRVELLARLAGLGDFEVVTDPEPTHPVKAPIRTYLEALRRTPPAATHRVIVQDDAVPGDRFLARLGGVLAEHPSQLLALFIPGWTTLKRRAREAVYDRGESGMVFPAYNWCPTVALCWPVELIEDFLVHAEVVIETRRRRGMATIGDDPYVGSWVRKRKLSVWCPLPCLVEHPDDVGSIFMPTGKEPKAGRNGKRTAALFVG